MNVFVDTNIFVYTLDVGDEAKRLKALEVLANTQHRIVISTQVLFEFYAVVSRKLQPALPQSVASEAARYLAQFPVVVTDSRLALRAINTAARDQVSIWDAAMIEAAVAGDCKELWTEDLSTGATLRGVKIVNPLA